jgi:Kef-type K+ transport system membrane component KefB
MGTATTLLLHIFLMFVAARLAGEVCTRWGQSAVIGELIVGMVLGPFALGWIGIPSGEMMAASGGSAGATDALESVYEVLAELGVIVLLFVVGLETKLADMLQIGLRAVAVAAGGIGCSFGLIFAFALLIGEPRVVAIFIGTALVATSIGITARVMADLGVIGAGPARIILGAAIIDDILTMIALTLVSAIGQNGGLSLPTILLVVGEAAAFAVVVAFAGRHLVRRWGHRLEHLRMQNPPFSVAAAIMLGLAVVSTEIGLAAIIGAFLAGMVFSEIREEYELERQVQPLYDFLVPLFFVITGSRVDWHIFLDGSMIGVALALTLLAILGKVFGCGLGALTLGRRVATIVGVGMVPRGEVSLIVASTGRSLGLISSTLFSAIVVVVVLTTFVVPPCLTVLLRAKQDASGDLPPVSEPALADADGGDDGRIRGAQTPG